MSYANKYDETLIPVKFRSGAPVLPIVGLALVLVATLAIPVFEFVPALNKLSFKKWIVIAFAALAVLGGVFMFFFKDSGRDGVSVMIELSRAQVDELIAEKKVDEHAVYNVVSGVLFIDD